MLIKIFLYML